MLHVERIFFSNWKSPNGFELLIPSEVQAHTEPSDDFMRRKWNNRNGFALTRSWPLKHYRSPWTYRSTSPWNSSAQRTDRVGWANWFTNFRLSGMGRSKEWSFEVTSSRNGKRSSRMLMWLTTRIPTCYLSRSLVECFGNTMITF